MSNSESTKYKYIEGKAVQTNFYIMYTLNIYSFIYFLELASSFADDLD